MRGLLRIPSTRLLTGPVRVRILSQGGRLGAFATGHRPFGGTSAVCTVLSVLLGSLLLWAAVHKSIHPSDSERLLDATLHALPSALSIRSLVVLEIALGTALLGGFSPRVVLGAFIGMLFIFSGVLFLARARGFHGSCGCFGLDGSVEAALVRNAVLAVLALVGFFAHEMRMKHSCRRRST